MADLCHRWAMPASSASRNRLSSVANAAQVLKSFSANHPTWGVSELAAHLDLSTSTVHRLLSTLADEGVLEQEAESGRYRLARCSTWPGHADQRCSRGGARVDDRAAQPHRRPQSACSTGAGVYVERLDSPNTLRVFAELGRRPLHQLGQGPARLRAAGRAGAPARRLGAPGRTEHSITSVPELRRELEAIRRQGYAENRQESELGVVSVAAPIRDGSGRAVASLNLAGPSERMDPNRGTPGGDGLASTVSRRWGGGLVSGPASGAGAVAGPAERWPPQRRRRS